MIIDACPRLSQLNLTSCRGVEVLDRRRFFEVSLTYNTDHILCVMLYLRYRRETGRLNACFTERCIFVVIDACPRPSQLNLTSCKGVAVLDRRRVFEVSLTYNTDHILCVMLHLRYRRETGKINACLTKGCIGNNLRPRISIFGRN